MILSIIALTALFPVFLVLAVLGAVMMRENPFFTQPRPGRIDPVTGKEKIFSLIKFKSMKSVRNEKGEMLSDEARITPYGRWLRRSSLDELPQLINIILGDMSIVGPRPQLVRDMVFMSQEERKRHQVRPGLTGLAQVKGRNCITWEDKFRFDLEYLDNICFLGDIEIVWKTVFSVFQNEERSSEDVENTQDLGDYLLLSGLIDKERYEQKLNEAEHLLEQ